MTALTEDQKRALRREIERNMWSMMDEDMERFFYENPDVLKHVFAGTFHQFFERASFRPSYDKPLTRMEDGAGWKFLNEGKVWVSLVTRTISVDYRPDPKDFITAADVTAFPDDLTGDLEHSGDRTRILRAGGIVARKRLTFGGSVSIDVIRTVIRLLNWKGVDARTLLAWQKLYGREVGMEGKWAASEIRLYRRHNESYHIAVCLDRPSSCPGEIRYIRWEVGPSVSMPEFPTSWTFLAEVPNDSAA